MEKGNWKRNAKKKFIYISSDWMIFTFRFFFPLSFCRCVLMVVCVCIYICVQVFSFIRLFSMIAKHPLKCSSVYIWHCFLIEHENQHCNARREIERYFHLTFNIPISFRQFIWFFFHFGCTSFDQRTGIFHWKSSKIF